MNAQTSFGPQGQSITTTSGGDLPITPALPGAGHVDPAFIAFLRGLVQQRSGGGSRGAGKEGGNAPKSTYNSVTPFEAASQAAATEQINSQRRLMPLQEAAAAQNVFDSMYPAPIRATSFASNANNGYTLDPLRMTGAQRQAFLPQGSSFQAKSKTYDKDGNLTGETF